MGRTVDTYKEVKTFSFENMTVRVHIPDITETEKTRRMQKIHTAAAELLRSKKE